MSRTKKMKQISSLAIKTSKTSKKTPILTQPSMMKSKTLIEEVLNNKINKTTVYMRALSKDVRAID